MIAAKIIFWCSLCGILFAYGGYPLFLWVVSIFRSNKAQTQSSTYVPRVSLLISVHNEERSIDPKLENALALDYPKKSLEIIVVSDASSDRTDEIVRQFSDQGIRLLRQHVRKGKSAALNMAVAEAKGEIIVFSDGNAMYDGKAVKYLVRHFRDPSTGFVSGITKYISNTAGSSADSTGLYSRLEHSTKRLESLIGSCVGADGAIFAIRKEVYTPLKAHDINDLVIPLQIVGQGFRGMLEERAFCLEKTAGNLKGEFNRQVRISTRTIRAIFENRGLLNPIRWPFFSFQLISHKLLKLLVPFFMILTLVTNVLLVTTSLLYYVLLVFQVWYYVLVWWGHLDQKAGRANQLTGMAHAFSFVNCALLLGWIKYFQGETYSTWSPERT
jgi:cellulose synthase/poly-beta-1,6-N-acetylglucosamine synthase-like glycosyltransferase